MVNNTDSKQLFRTHGYVIILLVFGAMILISLSVPISDAANENMNTVYVSSNKMQYNISEPISFVLVNVGTLPYTIYSNTSVLVVGSNNNQPVYQGTLGCNAGQVCAQNYWEINLNTGQTYTWTWNQKNNNNVQVSSGSYYGIIDKYSSNSFTIMSNYTNTTPTPNSTPNATPTPTPNVTTTPTPTPTSTPNLNNTCVDDVSYGDTLNTVVGDGIKFAFLPSSNFTNKTSMWDVSWYVNNTTVKNDPRISNASVYINNGSTIGIWNVTAIATNNCDKSQITWKWTINPKPPAPSSSGGGSSGGSSSGSSSGGGGGGGVSSPESYNNIDHFMSKSNDIFAGKSVAYQFTLPNFAIYEIDVIGSLSDNDVGIRLEHLKNISFTADKIPAGIIYANENVWINSKRISSIHIKFKVPKTWIKNNNLNSEDIKLLKYDGNWWKLNTKAINNDSDYIYYETMTNSQSVFAISGLKDSIKYAEKIDNSTDTSLQPLYNSTNQSNNVLMKPLNTEPVESTKMMVGIGVIILVLVIVSYGITQIRRHLKKKEGT